MRFNDKEKLKRFVTFGLAIGGLVGMLVFGLWWSDRDRDTTRARDRVPEVTTFPIMGGKQDPASAWIAKSEGELSSIHEQNKNLSKTLEDIQAQLAHLQEEKQKAQEESLKQASDQATTSNLNEDEVDSAEDEEGYPQASTLPLPRIFPSTSVIKENEPVELATPASEPRSLNQLVREEVGGGLVGKAQPQDEANYQIISVSLKPSKPVNDKKESNLKAKNLENFLPAGSFIQVTLLSGANAPTGGNAQSDPIPVLLQLDDDGNLPNKFVSTVRDCRITTSAYGDLPSERAYLRTEKLTCVNHEGQILEKNLRGYVSGEDGMAGMRGRVVEKRGRLLALSLLSGTLSGIGDGISQGLTTLSTNALGSVEQVEGGKAIKHGAYSGIANAMERMADWYLERANELYPVIEIHTGRFGHVVLTEGLDLDVDLWNKEEG